jgi:hypothetical protein
LAVLWDFKGLQGLKTKMIRFQIYSPRRPPFGLIPDAIARHSTASPCGFEAFSGSQAIVLQESGGAFIGGGLGVG